LDEIGIPLKNVKYLLLTHVHLDHGGAAGSLIKQLPNAYVIAHKRGTPHLVDPEASLWKSSNKVLGFVADIYGKPEPVPKDKIISVDSKMSLIVGKCSFEIIPTPGHSSHHICFLFNPGKIIFTGDAAGSYLPNIDISLPQTPTPFRLELTLKSIEALISLDPEHSAYTHFGVSPNAVKNLKRHYNQLLIWHEIVIDALNKGIAQEVIMDLISIRDIDLKNFLIYSEKLKGVKRGVELSIKGFVDFVLEEKMKN
jgi:glyoxylase-like metal-dependent hydrolase (beta-lactamase superfamily II)